MLKRMKVIESKMMDIYNTLSSDIERLKQENDQLRRILENNVCGKVTGFCVNTTQDSSKNLMKKCDLYLYKGGKEYIFTDFMLPRFYDTGHLKMEINRIEGSDNLALIRFFHFDKSACSYCVDLDTQQYIRTDGRIEICSFENINGRSKN